MKEKVIRPSTVRVAVKKLHSNQQTGEKQNEPS